MTTAQIFMGVMIFVIPSASILYVGTQRTRSFGRISLIAKMSMATRFSVMPAPGADILVSKSNSERQSVTMYVGTRVVAGS